MDLVRAAIFVAIAEWLRSGLFLWSFTGWTSAVGLAIACVILVAIETRSASSWRLRFAGAAVLFGATGVWSLWARWLVEPLEPFAPRTILPLAACLLTTWLFLEWSTHIARARWIEAPSENRTPDVMWLPIIGLSFDLSVRLLSVHFGLGLLVIGLWLLNRRIPLLHTTWRILAHSPWGLVALLGLAFALRAAFAWRLELAGLDPAILDGPDSGYYHAAATAIAGGDVTLWQPSWLLYPRHNPGPVLLYGLLYRIVGPHVIAVRIVQLVLAVWSCLLIYSIAKRLFNDAVARVAAFLVAGRGYLIVYGSYVGAETLGLFFAALCVWWWLRLIQNGSRVSRARRAGWMLGSGLAASWLILIRPEYFLFPLVGSAVSCWKVKSAARTQWVVIAALSLLLPLGWTVRNGIVFGVWKFQDHKRVVEAPNLERLGVLTIPAQIADSEGLTKGRSSLMPRIDWNTVARDPVRALIAAGLDSAEKIAYLWSWRPYVSVPALTYFGREEPFVVFVSFILGVGLLVGLWSTGRSQPGVYLFYCLFGTKTLVHAVSAVREWHRFTMEPFLNIIQASGSLTIAAWLIASTAIGQKPQSTSVKAS